MGTNATLSYQTTGTFNFLGSGGYPVPAISISQEYQRDGAGRQIGITVGINIEGKIFSGSGNSGINQLLVLESGLRKAFTYDGGNLSVGCGSTITIFSGIKISRYSANKTEDNWTTTIDYSIDLQSEIRESGTGIFYVSSTQDDWNIETIDEFSYATSSVNMSLLGYNNSFSLDRGGDYPFFRVSRTVGAVGKYVAEPGIPVTGSKTAVKHAKEWVKWKTSTTPKHNEIINGLNLYNFVRSINESDSEGSYRITDNWIATKNNIPYSESFTVESALDSSMIRTVTVQGTVKGLEAFNSGQLYTGTIVNGDISSSITDPYSNTRYSNNSGTKFYNAVSGYSGIKCGLYSRAQLFATTGAICNTTFNFNSTFGRNELSLNPIPVSITEGMNPYEGTVTYNYSFNNRPQNIVPNALSESLSVDDNSSIPLVASIFVLGRKLGPILQDLGTTTAATRSVSFEVVFPKPSSLRDITFPSSNYSIITGIIESFNPERFMVGTTVANGIKAYVTRDTTNWNPSEGRLTKQKEWQWVKCFT